MSSHSTDEATLFDQALQIEDAAMRSRYLDEACDGDTQLRERLERLLLSHEQANSFFTEGERLLADSEERNRLREIADEALTGNGEFVEEPVGVRIGHYNLIKRIGDGGCGVVYLAEQEQPVRRMVAMKIVRIGMESRQVIERFKAERQALAMMDHPHIARVFDAGETQSGSPYFVMEHVKGVKITEYCESNRLSIHDRLQLFIQICHAIQHAHQKGIIHGDIKPSNIMVCQQDGVAIPKVIDFGIARATESRLFDRDAFSKEDQLMGTPAYMSPEQMEMNGFDVDTRSDIYSLGVLLYQLLAGRTPLDGRRMMDLSAAQMRELLKNAISIKPSSCLLELKSSQVARLARDRELSASELLHLLRNDLDWVVMKALQKDRSLRYETANALAMDVQRVLDNQVVLARPMSWHYGMRKFIRRNRVVFVASLMVAASLVAGMGVSTWLLFKERAARHRAVAAEQQQMRLRQEAEVRQRVTEAAWLISQGRPEAADELMLTTPLQEASVEGAAVVRAIGEWHGIRGRWKEAAHYFEVLLQVNRFESADVASLDLLELGPVLVKLGDSARYEDFRHHAVERYRANGSAFADRFLKIVLLKPASEVFTVELRDMVAQTERAVQRDVEVGDFFEAAWRSMSVALYELRRGDYSTAVAWCDACLAYPDNNAPRTVAVHAIRGMAYHMMARNPEARTELAAAVNLMETKFRDGLDRGTPVHGFWFDWLFGQILMEEARRLIAPETLALAD